MIKKLAVEHKLLQCWQTSRKLQVSGPCGLDICQTCFPPVSQNWRSLLHERWHVSKKTPACPVTTLLRVAWLGWIGTFTNFESVRKLKNSDWTQIMYRTLTLKLDILHLLYEIYRTVMWWGSCQVDPLTYSGSNIQINSITIY